MITTFTKLDIIIESMTGKEHKRIKLHKEMEYYMPSKPHIMLEEGIQYRFPANLTEIARRWLDVKLIKNDKELGV